MVLIFAALCAAGVFGVLFSLDLAGYKLADLSQQIGLSGIVSSIEGFVGSVEAGSPALGAALAAAAIPGLVLLFLELKPGKPSRVRLDENVYMGKRALKREAESSAASDEDVLKANAKVKVSRSRKGKVKIKARSRPGENSKSIKQRLSGRLRRELGQEAGLPVGSPKIKLSEGDAKSPEARVR